MTDRLYRRIYNNFCFNGLESKTPVPNDYQSKETCDVCFVAGDHCLCWSFTIYLIQVVHPHPCELVWEVFFERYWNCNLCILLRKATAILYKSIWHCEHKFGNCFNF